MEAGMCSSKLEILQHPGRLIRAPKEISPFDWLPTEVTWLILQYMPDDNDDTKSVSQVCKAWNAWKWIHHTGTISLERCGCQSELVSKLVESICEKIPRRVLQGLWLHHLDGKTAVKLANFKQIKCLHIRGCSSKTVGLLPGTIPRVFIQNIRLRCGSNWSGLTGIKRMFIEKAQMCCSATIQIPSTLRLRTPVAYRHMFLV